MTDLHGALARTHQPEQAASVMAYAHPDGRVVRAETMASARKDGGAMLSSLAGYTISLVPAQQAAQVVPEVLFDGYAVLQGLDDKAKARTSAENVSDVLDAVVRLIRAASQHGEGA